MLRRAGDPAGALARAEEAIETSFKFERAIGATIKDAFDVAIDSALTLGDHETAERLLGRIDELKPGQLPPSLRAQSFRFRARLSAARGEHERAEAGFEAAERIFREFGLVYWLAVAQLEHAEWLSAAGRRPDAEPHLAEARATFERLEAAPWLERCDALARPAATIGAQAN